MSEIIPITKSLTINYCCATPMPAPELCLDNAVGSATTPQVKTSKRGGPRPGFGGPQPGSGRPRKIQIQLPTQISYATDRPRWFCIRLPYLTDDAASQINDMIMGMGFETLYPQEWVPPVAAHRTEAGRAIPARSERRVPLLRSYALVKFDRTDQSWRYLAKFGQVLGSPEWPTPIPDSDIAALRKDLTEDDILYPPAVPDHTPTTKRRWVDMATALIAIQTEAV